MVGFGEFNCNYRYYNHRDCSFVVICLIHSFIFSNHFSWLENIGQRAVIHPGWNSFVVCLNLAIYFFVWLHHTTNNHRMGFLMNKQLIFFMEFCAHGKPDLINAKMLCGCIILTAKVPARSKTWSTQNKDWYTQIILNIILFMQIKFC